MNQAPKTALLISASLWLTLQAHTTPMPTMASTLSQEAVQVAINPQPLPPRRPPPTFDARLVVRV